MATTTPATDNPIVQTLITFYDQFQRRDPAAMELMIDTFDYDGIAHPLFPHSDILQSKMAFLTWAKTYNAKFEHLDLSPTQFEVKDDIVSTLLSMTYRNNDTGEVATIPAYHHWKFKDGKAAGLRVTGV